MTISRPAFMRVSLVGRTPQLERSSQEGQFYGWDDPSEKMPNTEEAHAYRKMLRLIGLGKADE
jgi:hypothetical protein